MANVIKVEVADRAYTVDGSHDPLVSGNVGRDFVNATFDSEWDGLTTYCVYACGSEAIAAPFEVGADNEIPHEVLVPGALRLTFVGYDSDNAEVLRTKHARFGEPVKASGQGMTDREREATVDVAMAAKERLDELEAEIPDAQAATTAASEAATAANAAADRVDACIETAAADHEQATADHAAASSDHAQAESDTSRAATDHETASADHATATADHKTAASDHTQASSDTKQAASDHTTATSDHTASESATTAANEAASNATEKAAEAASAATDARAAIGYLSIVDGAINVTYEGQE